MLIEILEEEEIVDKKAVSEANERKEVTIDDTIGEKKKSSSEMDAKKESSQGVVAIYSEQGQVIFHQNYSGEDAYGFSEKSKTYYESSGAVESDGDADNREVVREEVAVEKEAVKLQYVARNENEYGVGFEFKNGSSKTETIVLDEACERSEAMTNFKWMHPAYWQWLYEASRFATPFDFN